MDKTRTDDPVVRETIVKGALALGLKAAYGGTEYTYEAALGDLVLMLRDSGFVLRSEFGRDCAKRMYAKFEAHVKEHDRFMRRLERIKAGR